MHNNLKVVCGVGALALVAGAAFAKDTPVILGTRMRSGEPTIMDIAYKVTSDKAKVNVRALAYQDGVRSFLKVVRPNTFVNDADGNPTAGNIGDGVPANTQLKLSWKVPPDWGIDLAKVKFEILCSDVAQLPLKLITIPATDKHGSFTVAYGTQQSSDVMNAMLWHYAAGAKDLTIDNGYLLATNHTIQADGTHLVDRTSVWSLSAMEYVYDKMGYGILNGALQEYARAATRKALTPGGVTIYGYKRAGAPESVYVGEKAYCVIDVSAGSTAGSYPVTYLDSAPTAGWGDEYKTTKILLRRIEPGVVYMRNSYDDVATRKTTLTQPFYMGVFEVTQKQYLLVTGCNSSSHKGDRRPVESISWDTIRGYSSTYNWPTVKTVDPDSFMGRLQARTGLKFDLPTEAQWEYACRAGTTDAYNNGSDLNLLARFNNTQRDYRRGLSQHTEVGAYLSNLWGLYDMHGNVFEWCLDWHGTIDTAVPASDPAGAASGSDRVLRGGEWAGSVSWYFHSSDRDHSHYGPSARNVLMGFRLCRTLAEGE